MKYIKPSAVSASMFRHQLPRIKRVRSGLLISRLSLYHKISTTRAILEEDQHPHYESRKYYPAHVGETIFERYNIILKLGWGANSTVWLAKDTNR